jgi:glutamate synthase domain-containing protein 2
VFEHERSKIHQYFVEDDTNGTPYDREHRSDVYQKAKKDPNTTPFGTQLNVYDEGYEFMPHSMYPKDPHKLEEPRFMIGGKNCTQPYSASVFNISAMSFGALSNVAITSLSAGAKLGKFFHNTGEGGISQYHLEGGGDLCFQVGTGYFGAGITKDGVRVFDPEVFRQNAIRPEVKLIEIKLSQGAKPGHGGILPAKKNSPEIAAIRNVEAGTEVVSPPFHTAFDSPGGLLNFIGQLRRLSGGKPVGIKMCLGKVSEFHDLASKMAQTGQCPDFITIDGGEGGTGAAPLVFTNYVGTPLTDALIKVNRLLQNFGLRDKIRIIASGKVSNAFDVVRLVSLGADGVNAARAFMLSLGCIQARECDNNTCPVGVATQNKKLAKGLDPREKKVRVYNYHDGVIEEVKQLLAAAGVETLAELTPANIFRRVNGDVVSYALLSAAKGVY